MERLTSDDFVATADPVFSGDACVHALSPVATCRACADACPGDAIALGDDGLELDTQSCDGCGLCAAVCPETAISMFSGGRRLEPWIGRDGVAFAACDAIAERDHEAGRVTCLNAIGVGAIVRLANAGACELTVARAPCQDCARHGGGPLLPETLTEAARVLALDGCPGLKVRTLAPADWRTVSDRHAAVHRRRLLHAVLSPRATASERRGTNDRDHRPSVAAANGADTARFAPRIDPALCVACHACAEICPHAALKRHTDGGRSSYRVDAAACTGCGVCRDICEANAVDVLHWPRPLPGDVPLADGRCRKCGNSFQMPAGRDVPSSRAGLCRICATGAGRKALFQVVS